MDKITTDILNFYKTYQGMNRAAKRKLAKKMKTSFSDLKDSMKFEIADMTVEEIPEGAKVRLKYDRIMEQKEHLSNLYLSWIEKNKDKVFTFEPYDGYEDGDGKRGTFVEDVTNPKWIFHVTDLVFDIDYLANN